MSFYDRLITETATQRDAFLQILIVANSVRHGAAKRLISHFLLKPTTT